MIDNGFHYRLKLFEQNRWYQKLFNITALLSLFIVQNDSGRIVDNDEILTVIPGYTVITMRLYNRNFYTLRLFSVSFYDSETIRGESSIIFGDRAQIILYFYYRIVGNSRKIRQI